ncbi:MAG TPA: helix-turn-helix transcriptional regulator [Streptosporangiaceae bacterium]|jgi:transcriptional regulator with XRE-family HTH domain|nr:helix-turn-helix transcriptional regulator [Streptosporangiaceae bacterium]
MTAQATEELATWPAASAASDEIRRAELAAFLRSRRERISPQQVGVSPLGRRRTPGLRREEVAQLAGVGVTWYTWLEQGRDIKVSDQVLEAIARTLMLDRDEHAHLFSLAGSADPQQITAECAAVPPQLRRMLTQLEPFPASVVNAKYDLLAYNRTYARLFDDLDAVPRQDRNCMWLCFTDPAWRKALLDWEDAATRMVANLRWLMADHVAEPSWKSLVKRLRAASPEFAELWERHEVRSIENKTKHVRNPLVGELRLDVMNTWLSPHPGTRLHVYSPADETTEQRLHELAAIIRGPA